MKRMRQILNDTEAFGRVLLDIVRQYHGIMSLPEMDGEMTRISE